MGKITSGVMKSIGEVNSNHENDSDDDSFNSCVDYVQNDLYDDVLFHHAMASTCTFQVEEQDKLLRRSDSFSSASSNGQARCTSSVFRSKKQDVLMTRARNDSFSTATNIDGESCDSSHLLSSGTSKDDDLSYVTDNTSFGRKIGLSVMSSTQKEEQNEEQTEDIMHWDAPKSSDDIATLSSNCDEWSMMSHLDEATVPSRESTTGTSAATSPLGCSSGFFGTSSF